MITLTTCLFIFWCHFCIDFIAQDDDTATNKSEKFSALACHTLLYTLCIIPLGAIITLNQRDPLPLFLFVLLNGFAHGFVDYFTSKASKYFFMKGQRHNFFVMIGFDQAIHMSILFYTAVLFGGKI